ncbi:MAG TPA: hypothetical protein VJ904_09175, partial [Tichowtungia sp.]|nr:hypothetical protein [Tichowtungia sp.]
MKALCFLYVCITALLLVSCKVQEDVAEESPAKQASPEQSTAASSKETLPESWVNPPRDEVPKKEYVKPEQAPLVSMGPDGRLVYNAYSDKGDRILDFSTCGYKASEEPIPNIPAVVTLTPPAGEAVPDGNMAYPKGPDSVELIQNALDKVDAMNPGNDGFRGAVLLKKGTWYVNGSLRIGSGVVLRGEGDGENGTVLIFKGAGGKGTGIQLGNPKGRAGSAGSPTRITDHYVPSGAVRFTVEDPGLFKVGDDVRIVKTVNEQWVEDIGCGERLRHIRGGKEGA